MLKAWEAKEKALEVKRSNDTQMEKVEELVIKAAARGETSVRTTMILSSKVISDLCDLGYEVSDIPGLVTTFNISFANASKECDVSLLFK